MIAGSLLTECFLREGMTATQAWRTLDPAEVLATADALRGEWQRLAAMARPNEATTEQAFIYPALRRLGWHFLPQQAASRDRRDIADALLFRSAADRDRAAAARAPADAFRRRGRANGSRVM